MSKKNCIIAASDGLLAIAFALLLTGQLPAGEDDTQAEKAIQALGGRIVRTSTEPGRPITSVDFTNTKVTDAGLKELAGLKSLKTLNLGNTKVTDVGLKELAGLKSLRILYLFATPVTDVGLKELAGLNNLQTLYINRTKVTDKGVAELRKALPKCYIIQR